METGVDDLEARISKRASDHFGAPVVTVEAGFRDDDSIGALHQLPSIDVSPTALIWGIGA
jgi:hypothetical protein